MRRPIIYEDEKQQKVRIKRRASALRSAEKKKEGRLLPKNGDLESENQKLKRRVWFLESKVGFLETFLDERKCLPKRERKEDPEFTELDHLEDIKIAYYIRPHQGLS